MRQTLFSVINLFLLINIIPKKKKSLLRDNTFMQEFRLNAFL